MKTIVPRNNELLPLNIGICQTTVGAFSDANGYGTQNMGFHVSDFDANVHTNRMQLLQYLQPQGVETIHWLHQVHGTDIVTINRSEELSNLPHNADALVTRQKGIALAVMTADCLPIVLTNTDGSEIASIHAGWRGLAQGIVEKTVQKMHTKPTCAWIGSAIHQKRFEVGQAVYNSFVTKSVEAKNCFEISENSAENNKKYMANLPRLAQLQLQDLDITVVTSDQCSYQSDDFYSHRQATHQGNTDIGRMVTLIWIK